MVTQQDHNDVMVYLVTFEDRSQDDKQHIYVIDSNKRRAIKRARAACGLTKKRLRSVFEEKLSKLDPGELDQFNPEGLAVFEIECLST